MSGMRTAIPRACSARTARCWSSNIRQVSPDGQRIETIEGGIRAADWHATSPPGPDPNPPCPPGEICDEPEDPGNPKDCPIKGASTICQGNGNLSVDVPLPVYRSLEQDRSWKFIYRSDTARPRPQVSFDAGLGAPPRSLSYRLRLGGQELPPVHVSMPRRSNAALRQGVAVPARGLSSGRIPYQVMVTGIWAQTQVGTPIESYLLLDNAGQSPFGAGWRLEGLEELHVSPAGITRIRPGNRPLFYERSESGWVTPDADFSELQALDEGGYRITEKDGMVCEFTAQGQMTVRRDRNGNTLRYHYGAQGRRIIKCH